MTLCLGSPFALPDASLPFSSCVPSCVPARLKVSTRRPRLLLIACVCRSLLPASADWILVELCIWCSRLTITAAAPLLTFCCICMSPSISHEYCCPRICVSSSTHSSFRRSSCLYLSASAARRHRSASCHMGLRRRPRCTFPARTNRCHANSIRTRHPRPVAHVDVPSEAKLRRRASIS